MEIEEDFWFWLAVLVSVAAMVVWAFSSVTHIGDESVPWIAGAVMVLALLAVSVRAGLKARGIVWTPELKEAQRRRANQHFADSGLTILMLLLMQVLIKLGREAILPQWTIAVLLIALIAGRIWLGRKIRTRNTRHYPNQRS